MPTLNFIQNDNHLIAYRIFSTNPLLSVKEEDQQELHGGGTINSYSPAAEKEDYHHHHDDRSRCLPLLYNLFSSVSRSDNTAAVSVPTFYHQHIINNDVLPPKQERHQEHHDELEQQKQQEEHCPPPPYFSVAAAPATDGGDYCSPFMEEDRRQYYYRIATSLNKVYDATINSARNHAAAFLMAKNEIEDDINVNQQRNKNNNKNNEQEAVAAGQEKPPSSFTSSISTSSTNSSTLAAQSDNHRTRIIKSFQHRLEDLLNYKMVHGTLFNISKRRKENSSLATWCSEVRIAYGRKIRNASSRSRFSDEHFRALFEIGLYFGISDYDAEFPEESVIKRKRSIETGSNIEDDIRHLTEYEFFSSEYFTKFQHPLSAIPMASPELVPSTCLNDQQGDTVAHKFNQPLTTTTVTQLEASAIQEDKRSLVASFSRKYWDSASTASIHPTAPSTIQDFQNMDSIQSNYPQPVERNSSIESQEIFQTNLPIKDAFGKNLLLGSTSTTYTKFDQRIRYLEAYTLEHGTLMKMPTRYKGYRSLGAWVAEVRFAYKKKIAGLPYRSKLSDDQYRQLYELGFDFHDDNTEGFGVESDLKRQRAMQEAKLRFEERKKMRWSSATTNA